MKKTLAELQTERRQLAAQITTTIDEAEQRVATGSAIFAGEDEAKYQQLNTRYDEVLAELRAMTEQSGMQARRAAIAGYQDTEGRGGGGGRPAGGSPRVLSSDDGDARADAVGAFRHMLLAGTDHADVFRGAAKRHFERTGKRMAGGNKFAFRRLPVEQMRAVQRGETRTGLDKATSTSGAELVPTLIATQLDIVIGQFNPMRNLVEVIRTDAGETLPFPQADDTGNEGEYVAEKGSIETEATPVTANANLGAHKASSKLVKISYELLTDAAFDVIAYLTRVLGERIGRLENKSMSTGDGTGKPRGFTLDAGVGKTAVGTTAVVDTELIDLFYSVPEPYRSRAVFMLNDAIAASYRKLKDSEGRFIWQPGLTGGQPDKLLGRDVISNPNMASAMAAGAIVTAFGDFGYYRFREAGASRLVILREKYAATDEIGIILLTRHDGRLYQGAKAVKVLKNAAS